jgi:ATP-binding cassette subfamily F protein 3
MPNVLPERRRAHLGGFGLGQNKADLAIEKLSGGEKARLTFALISAGKPQVLVLDEPTNHLDIESREALVEAINGFAGAVILISHDRHLIELTADRLWLVAGGRVRPYEGDLDDYRRLLLAPERSRQADKAEDRAPAGQLGDGARRRRDPVGRSEVLKLRQAARSAEQKLEKLTADRARVAAKLADQRTYAASGDELDGLLRRNAELDALIEAAERTWLQAAEALERAEN